MLINTNIRVCGSPVVMIVRQITEERLVKTCFRGIDVKLAGNFLRWNSSFELLSDAHVKYMFIRDIDEAFRNNSWNNSVCIEYGLPVGWSGTDDVSKYSQSDLEDFEPNRRSRASRVRLDRRDLLAPKTDLLTIVYELKREETGYIVAVVHSIYPGKDIGELRGDITQSEQVVFFDWNHPGIH
jgi:hypothetical protein